MKPRALIVDDEANMRLMLEAVLADEGFEVRQAASGAEALTAIPTFEPDLALVDLVLGDGPNGMAVLEQMRARHPDLVVVMMSGQANLADAVRATKLGAFQFLEKPVSQENVVAAARAGLELARARTENRALRAALESDAGAIVGSSGVLEDVRRLIAQVAPTKSRVLITGESGTGKELVARAIHAQSPRARQPLVSLNCAAVPRDLVESELFGHERGAFTGATARRIGKFELAHGGTLFLDEIGELDAQAQAKLLRVIETGVVERVGGSSGRTVDVRLVAATNRDLEAEARAGAGRFRPDLFFRLNVFPIRMPALRERLEDLPELLRHLSARMARQCNRMPRTFGDDAVMRLRQHTWPGNVRELANLIERLTIIGQGPVTPGELDAILGRRASAVSHPPGRRPTADGVSDIGAALDAYERALIEAALEQSGGNVAEAARRLSTDRSNLHRRMRRLGIGRNDTARSQ
jgi:two-component system, NtrC family, nitrogen regulation response regulator NtrX